MTLLAFGLAVFAGVLRTDGRKAARPQSPRPTEETSR